MNYADFEALAFSNTGLLTIYWIVGFSCLFLLTRKYSRGLFVDPFHFYYTFTYGTSYGVVALLATMGLIDLDAFWIVFCFGAIFLISYRFFLKTDVINFRRLVNSVWLPTQLQEKSILVMMLIYVILAIANLSVAGFGFLAESRFESTIGYGPIIRVVEPLRLLLTAWFGLKIVKRWQSGKDYFFFSILLIFFILFSSLLNGAKFAFLEGFYAIAIAVIVAKIKFKISSMRLYFFWGALIVVIMFFTLFVLRYNISSTGGDPFAESQSIVGVPVLVERFIGRIMWNGDMYFLSLPNEVYKHISIDNFITRFATAIFGSQLVSPIVGYDAAQHEVGRLIWLYWAPDDDVMRGPTNHFDLTAYFYFGPIFGIFFVIVLALVLSQFNRLIFTRDASDDYRAIIVSVLWCKAVSMLMHPAAGFAWCIDVVFILIICKSISIAISKNNIEPSTDDRRTELN